MFICLLHLEIDLCPERKVYQTDIWFMSQLVWAANSLPPNCKTTDICILFDKVSLEESVSNLQLRLWENIFLQPLGSFTYLKPNSFWVFCSSNVH